MVGHDKITPDGKKFYKEIDELKKLSVRAGFQAGAETENNGTDLADVAMWNELGTSTIPPRPFLRESVDQNQDRISARCKSGLQAIAKGEKSAHDVLQELGVMQKGLIQQSIVSGSWVPNAPATIKRKGSDKPLIDTGHMRQSVSFVIQPKGSD